MISPAIQTPLSLIFKGYIGSGDPVGEVCTEINECLDNSTIPHNCDELATCSNEPLGSFTCNCNPVTNTKNDWTQII